MKGMHQYSKAKILNNTCGFIDRHIFIIAPAALYAIYFFLDLFNSIGILSNAVVDNIREYVGAIFNMKI
jgi:hypothetical protein